MSEYQGRLVSDIKGDEMAKKTVGISEESYQYLKARADAEGTSIGQIVSNLVESKSLTKQKSEVEQVDDERPLETEEIDRAQGYKRKPGEVTARDGLEALFAISKSGKNDIGVDRS